MFSLASPIFVGLGQDTAVLRLNPSAASARTHAVFPSEGVVMEFNAGRGLAGR
jgi:hypothetical protein